MGAIVVLGNVEYKTCNAQKLAYSLLFSNLTILITSILRFLTSASEIRLGSISFFVLLFHAQAVEVQEGSVHPSVFVYSFS